MTSPTVHADFLYARSGVSPDSFIAYRMRRCTGLSPSRTSGSARATMTLIEYSRNELLQLLLDLDRRASSCRSCRSCRSRLPPRALLAVAASGTTSHTPQPRTNSAEEQHHEPPITAHPTRRPAGRDHERRDRPHQQHEPERQDHRGRRQRHRARTRSSASAPRPRRPASISTISRLAGLRPAAGRGGRRLRCVALAGCAPRPPAALVAPAARPQSPPRAARSAALAAASSGAARSARLRCAAPRTPPAPRAAARTASRSRLSVGGRSRTSSVTRCARRLRTARCRGTARPWRAAG